MKKILLIFALFFAGFAVKAQYVWVSQATGFTQQSTGVRNVSAVDSNVVWISVYDGTGGQAPRTDYSRTVDGGLTWVPGTTPASAATYDWAMIFAGSADSAWALYWNQAVGTGGALYFTSDGGSTWAQQGVGTIYNATSFPDIIHFWDGLNGVTMGDPNPSEFEIYTTSDGGNTWVPVPGANIPDPIANEYGIIGHYSVIGDNIWFDTNKGRVYHSADKGLTWTVGTTGITVPTNGAIDICFYDANNGLARLYDATAGTNIMKTSSDAGATWNSAAHTGNFFGVDVKYIPGTTSRLISTGAATGFVGSSFSDDGGLNWIDFETSAQRTAIGAVDSNNIWVGGFSSSPTSDGIFKYTFVPQVSCTDPLINTGITAVTDTFLCPGDTLIVSSTGVYAPNNGAVSGVSWVITSADISASTDPLNEPSLVASYTFNFPAPTISTRMFINDGSLIGAGVPYGTYYWTPVVFGNATVSNPPPVFLNDLTLDPACTHAGTSMMVVVDDGTSPACAVGIAEANANNLSVTGNFTDGQNLRLIIRAANYEKAKLNIFDMTGRLIYTENIDLEKGINKTGISSKSFLSGLYLIQVETSHSKAVTKITRQ